MNRFFSFENFKVEFGFAFVIMLFSFQLLFYTYYNNNKNFDDTSEQVAHTNEVIQETEHVSSTLKSLSSAILAYSNTGNVFFLSKFQKDSASLFVHLADLKRLTRDESSQQNRYKNLEQKIAERIGISQELIRLVKQNQLEASKRLAESKRVKLNQAHLEAVIINLQLIEKEQLHAHKADLEGNVATSSKLVYMLNILVHLILFVGFGIVVYNFNLRKKIEQKLELQNDELELKVHERTAALSKSEMRFRGLVENSFEGINLTDAQGYAHYVSPASERITGYTLEDRRIVKFEEIVVDEDKERVHALYEVLKNAPGITHVFQVRVNKKDGSEIWLEGKAVNLLADESIHAIVLNFHDVSKTRAAQELVVQKETLFRAMVEHTQDLISLTDREGKIVYVSPAYEKVTGFSAEQIIGKSHALVLHPDFVSSAKEDLAKVLQNPGLTVKNNSRFLTKSGNYIDVEGTLTNFLQDGDIKAIVSNYRDISERKLAEENLERSEVKYRQLFERNPMPMWIAEKETFRFLDVNNAAISHYGYSKEEFLSMTTIDIRPEEDKKAYIALDRSSTDANRKMGIWRHVKKDGTVIFVDIISSYLAIDNKNLRLILANDITEKIVAEEKLFKSEKLYKTIASSIPGSIVSLIDTEMNFLLVEGDMLEKLDYSKESLLRKGISKNETREILGLTQSDLNEILQGETLVKETKLKGFDFLSRYVPIEDEQKKVYAILSTAVDISELKNTQRQMQKFNSDLELMVSERTLELQKSNELFTLLFESNPAALTINSLLTGKVLNCNAEFLNFFCFESKNEVIGKTSEELQLQVNLEDTYAKMAQLEEKAALYNLELNVRTKKGELKWVDTSVIKLTIEDVPCILTVSVDITERKNAVQQLKIANAELDSFSYSVSHDLRAPLRSISGFTQMLVNTLGDNSGDETKRFLKIIADNTVRMGNLIDDLLAFSRLGKQKLVKRLIDMDALFSHISYVLQQQSNSKSKIEIESPLLPIKADEDLIKQVIVNLLSNALKYSSKKENPVINISSKKENGHVVYCVKDNGAGFDMQFYSKLFGVFQRLHSTHEFSGTGVGLSIVQRIVEKHEGKVWAEGVVNEGASFYISLPEVAENQVMQETSDIASERQ